MNPADIRKQTKQFGAFFGSTIKRSLKPKALYRTATTSSFKKLAVDIVVLSVCSALLLLLVRSLLTSRFGLSALFPTALALLFFSLAYSLVFAGIFLFQRLSFRRLILTSVFFCSHSTITFLLPSFIVLVVYAGIEFYPLYYVFYLFILVPVLVFTFVYPFLFNRGVYKLLSLLISIACLGLTNLGLFQLLRLFPPDYEGPAQYIYDPIFREYVGNEIPEEGKAAYIIDNSQILVNQLMALTVAIDADTVGRASSQIDSITVQKDHLEALLGKLHFRRNKRSVEASLDIIEILESIKVQVKRLRPIPADYPTKLANIAHQIDQAIAELEQDRSYLARLIARHDQLQKELENAQNQSGERPDPPEAEALAAEVRSLTAEASAELARMESVREKMQSMMAEQDGLSATAEQVRINNNAVGEMNHLLETLQETLKKANVYVIEDTRIIRVHAMLWFVP
ncbi:MAG: hypothetical protein NTU62_11725 [Spirochaetes bacterium]|nr:hypothetical protein [Spirochaetota bacterium]